MTKAQAQKRMFQLSDKYYKLHQQELSLAAQIEPILEEKRKLFGEFPTLKLHSPLERKGLERRRADIRQWYPEWTDEEIDNAMIGDKPWQTNQ